MINKNNPDCYYSLSLPINRLGDGKVALVINRLNECLSDYIIDNSNNGHFILVCMDYRYWRVCTKFIKIRRSMDSSVSTKIVIGSSLEN